MTGTNVPDFRDACSGILLLEATSKERAMALRDDLASGWAPVLPEPGDSAGPAGAGNEWVAAALPPPPARVLDAGCGEGAASAWLTTLGYQVTGIDTDLDALAAARALGVHAIHADLASYDDEPFDAVVMLLSLHHMHPIDVAIDHAARLLRPDGRLVLDEFAWDWADRGTIRWFNDISAVLAAARAADALTWDAEEPVAGDDLADGWRAQHVRNGALCNTGETMISAVRARFTDVRVSRVPYLARHLVPGRPQSPLFIELHRIEREHLADGTLAPTGFRLTARKPPADSRAAG